MGAGPDAMRDCRFAKGKGTFCSPPPVPDLISLFFLCK